MTETIVKTLRCVSKIPELVDAKIMIPGDSKQSCTLEARWNVRNLENNEKSTISTSYLLQTGEDICYFPLVARDKRIILSSLTPCGKYSASITQDDDICFLTIASSDGQSTFINLKEKELHGKVYSDVELSSFCWSPDCSKFAYVAEKKMPKTSTYFATVSEKCEEGRGEKFAYIDDWGEQMTGQHESCVIIVDRETQELKVLNLPEGLCGGQIVWVPKGDAVVGVAFVTDPYRLGLIYCKNRDSVLFHLDLQDKFEELTARGQYVNNPRFSCDGSTLAYLRSPVGGPHVRSAQLCLMKWEDKKTDVLLDYVSRPMKIDKDEMFSGTYGTSFLPLRCWTSDSKKLVFSSTQYFGSSTFIIDVETKQISQVPLYGNVVVHDVIEKNVLLSKSTCTEPCQLILLKLDAKSEVSESSIITISPSIAVEGIPHDWQDTWTFINPNPHPKQEFSDLPIPVIYFGPTKLSENELKRPLIVWVHGGPHSAVPNTFSVSSSFFVKLGYSIIFPNFRGSLGQGRDSIESLPGFCGQTDVSDVYTATTEALKRYELVLDSSKVVLIGGSHGGFLVTHLAAQHPDLYKVVSSRNPVIDIASMTSGTDIPDWNFVEAGFGYEIGKNVTEDIMSKMLRMSPVHLVDNVKAPTLLLLGKADRRVPMSQGMMYHRMLLARNIPTKAYVYDDCHPLSKVEVEADTNLQTALWFQKHLGSSDH